MGVATIRELVEKVAADIRRVEWTEKGTAESAGSQLSADWKDLVVALALGPTADWPCPRCGHLGMRDATLCGYCWQRLTPPSLAARAVQ